MASHCESSEVKVIERVSVPPPMVAAQRCAKVAMSEWQLEPQNPEPIPAILEQEPTRIGCKDSTEQETSTGSVVAPLHPGGFVPQLAGQNEPIVSESATPANISVGAIDKN